MTESGKGLFIDLDGTLADSLPVMRIVYARFLAPFEKPDSDAEFNALNGPPLSEVVATLAATHALPGSHEALMTLFQETIAAAYLEVSPNEGAEALLAVARDQGRKIGVVTSNSSALTWSWLLHVGLAELIDTVVAGEDVSRGKPDPEPYLTAMAQTACAAEGSVAVEDTVTGARAALAAGLSTFLLADSNASADLGATNIATLSELTSALLKQQ